MKHAVFETKTFRNEIGPKNTFFVPTQPQCKGSKVFDSGMCFGPSKKIPLDLTFFIRV